MKNFYFIIIGLCVGTLLGLSLSPVLNVFLSAILPVLVLLLSILSGIDYETKQTATIKKIHVNPLPLMCCLIGVLAGAFAGIYLRIRMPEYMGTKVITGKEISSNPSDNHSRNNAFGLYGFSNDQCKSIENLHGKELLNRLQDMGLKIDCSDSLSLETIKTILCSK